MNLHRQIPFSLGRASIFLAALAACGGREAPPGSDTDGSLDALGPSPFVQTAFRVRTDTAADLNGDAGWRAPANEGTTVAADRPFRIRFELEGPALPPETQPHEAGSAPTGFGLQVRRNEGSWEGLLPRDFPYPDEISTPRVSIVSTTAYSSGERTVDLLSGSEGSFVPGEGVVLDSVTAPWPPAPGAGSPEPEARLQGEWEWPVVIRRYADGAVTNREGDTFTFRMVDGLGRAVEGDVPATLTLTVPPGLLGGTYVETPGVLGPWQASNGDLYFPMEPAETYNVLMVVKSGDGGVTWREVDGENRPTTDDLEGFATAFHQGRLFMLHQISEATYLHAFNTSDVAGAPDRWAIRDELVSRHSEPPVQVAALVARPDGSLVAFFGDSLGLRWRIRSPDGGWSDEEVVSTDPGALASGVMAVGTPDGHVHLAYTLSADGERGVWYRALRPDGALTPGLPLATGVGMREEDMGAVAPLVYLPETGSVVVLYRLADGFLYERRIGTDGSASPPLRVTRGPVVQCASDSDQVGADAVVYDGVVHVLYIDEDTRDLYHTRSDGAGEWASGAQVVEGINAQWVRGRILRGADGRPVYGFVYDAGSDGGSGMNWYEELPLGG